MHRAVRLRALMPPGHVRTPAYLRGKTGVIERSLGPFANPEQLAYGLPAEKKPLYRCASQWPSSGARRPSGHKVAVPPTTALR